MYPRLVFDMKKLQENLTAVSRRVKGAGCSLMIVTKVVCADEAILRMLNSHPEVDYLADSRIDNCKKLKNTSKETVLLRLTQESELEEVVRFADLSLQSERKTLRQLDQEARRQRKTHRVLLMIDMGDLREGIYFKEEEELFETISEILRLPNLVLYGIGTNLTCYGAVIPSQENLTGLVDIARRIEDRHSLKLSMISGGNSSSYHLIEKGELPVGINNLRLGEAFFLGNETAYGKRISGTHHDAVTLEAQVIELKIKPSVPTGEIGVDAFGKRPNYEDLGNRQRAILAVGKQDVDPESMTPVDPGVKILGSSSDHFILDVTDSDRTWAVGDVASFTLGYSGLLRAATSAYVSRSYT